MMKSLSLSRQKSTKKLMNSKYLVLIILLVVLGGYLVYNLYKTGKLECILRWIKIIFLLCGLVRLLQKFKPEWEKLKNVQFRSTIRSRLYR